ncbi:NADP-dependent oxidoreductase domain-containing protein [Xylariaceae sp. FL0255]|nr:NADP-dependent oxidoreductase domain-containing protein [Xylariaceae sp. FL0255]
MQLKPALLFQIACIYFNSTSWAQCVLCAEDDLICPQTPTISTRHVAAQTKIPATTSIEGTSTLVSTPGAIEKHEVIQFPALPQALPLPQPTEPTRAATTRHAAVVGRETGAEDKNFDINIEKKNGNQNTVVGTSTESTENPTATTPTSTTTSTVTSTSTMTVHPTLTLTSLVSSLPATTSDLGITLWDTTDIDGPYTNEELIGRWFKESGRRDEVFLATKFGNKFENDTTTIDGSPEYVKRALNENLQRLGTDRVDLYY